MAVFFALLSAVAYASASVLQQRAARAVPEEHAMRPGLLWRLIRRPLWLAGTAIDWLGFGFQAVALGLGSILVVQPMLCTGLLFALPLGAALQGRRLGHREWTGAVALSLGLAVFLVVGDPTEGKDFATTRAWLLALAILGPTIVVLVGGAMRRRNTRRAVLLALATAILYAITAVNTKSAVAELQQGIDVLLTSWEPYVGAVAAIVGLLLNQSAFQAGELGASLPTLTAVEPILGSLLGVLMLHEELRAEGVIAWLAVGVSAAVVVVAIVVLAHAAAQYEESAEVTATPSGDLSSRP
jgi:drug/metabolite transporter (DMT)-like permease